ncbi:hypothetical protein [Kitasatospora cineracea]|uniref:hypothetical protein n=1 Tax=Kitasatospora cineracea TaxID=88074 RepID=UPI0037F414C0
MTRFCTAADVAVRLGRPLADDETPRVEALIEDTSAFIADYCTGTWDRDNPPGLFLAVACAEVIRNLSTTPGVLMEKTGELEVQFGAAASALGLSLAAKDALSRYRRRAGTIALNSPPQEPSCE